MSARYPCGGPRRRDFLGAAAAATALHILGVTAVSAQEEGKDARGGPSGELGVPGPYPGRVVEVRNPTLVKDGKRNRGRPVHPRPGPHRADRGGQPDRGVADLRAAGRGGRD